MAGWTTAEEALYGPLLADPQAYERVVGLVGVLVAHLRVTVDDLPGLVAASRRGADLVAEVAPESALPWVPLDAALRAACAMRHRELLAVRQQQDRRNRLAEAAAAGTPWVRIVDAASVAADAVAPALVVHLASGMAVRCTTELDVETGGACFVTRPVVVNLTTGEVAGALDGVGAGGTAASLAQRDADLAELKVRIERLDSDGRVV